MPGLNKNFLRFLLLLCKFAMVSLSVAEIKPNINACEPQYLTKKNVDSGPLN
jgi:hypothetical protein